MASTSNRKQIFHHPILEYPQQNNNQTLFQFGQKQIILLWKSSGKGMGVAWFDIMRRPRINILPISVRLSIAWRRKISAMVFDGHDGRQSSKDRCTCKCVDIKWIHKDPPRLHLHAQCIFKVTWTTHQVGNHYYRFELRENITGLLMWRQQNLWPFIKFSKNGKKNNYSNIDQLCILVEESKIESSRKRKTNENTEKY